MNIKTKGQAKAMVYIMTILFIGGFIFLFITDSNNKRIEENGVHTQATVIDITSVHTKKGVRSVYGIAEYYDEQGVAHKYDGFLGNNDTEIGSKVDIIYNVDNPDEVIKENPLLIIFVIGFGVLAGIFLILSIAVTFGGKDRLAVNCMQQQVSDEELARIVREYMPQTKQKYQAKKSKNKGVDKIGDDAVLLNDILGGDPIGMLMKTGQKEAREFGNIYLCAVIRPTDQNIYSDKISFSDEVMEAASGRRSVPAFVVYGTDGYFEANPAELKVAASRLAGDVWGGQFSPEYMQLIDYLRNTSSRPFNVAYKGELTMGHSVMITTVVLDKDHLCNKKLCNKLHYILADPQRTKYAQILPAWYSSVWELSAF